VLGRLRRAGHARDAERVGADLARVSPREPIERRLGQRDVAVAPEDLDVAPLEVPARVRAVRLRAHLRAEGEVGIERRVRVRRHASNAAGRDDGRGKLADGGVPLREDPFGERYLDIRVERLLGVEVSDRRLHLHVDARRDRAIERAGSEPVIDEGGEVLLFVVQPRLKRAVGADDHGVGAPFVDDEALAGVREIRRRGHGGRGLLAGADALVGRWTGRIGRRVAGRAAAVGRSGAGGEQGSEEHGKREAVGCRFGYHGKVSCQPLKQLSGHRAKPSNFNGLRASLRGGYQGTW